MQTRSLPPDDEADDDGEAGSSLVFQTVEALRRRILAAAGDADPFLGTEDQLLESLGVSRPTFRQAARLLQHEQLLRVKRGLHGGCFARAPSPSVVSRLASIYLHFQSATLDDVSDAMSPLTRQAARLAALNPDAAARGRLVEMVEAQAGARLDARDELRTRLAFESLLAEVSGNALLALMMKLGMDLARHPRIGNVAVTPGQSAVYHAFHEQLALAVRDGDPDLAEAIVCKYSAQIRAWLADGPQ